MIIKDVCFNAGQMYKGDLYCSSSFFNGLIKVNINTGEAEFIQKFPEEEDTTIFLHRDAIYYNEQIVFIPQNAKGISIYKPLSNTFTYVPLKICENTCPISACAVNNIIWLFPVGKEEILALDMDTYRVKTYENVSGWGKMRTQKVLQAHGKLWLTEMGSNVITEFDPKSFNIQNHITDVKNITALEKGIGGFWIITNNKNEICFWDKKTEVSTRFEIEGNDQREGNTYANIIETANGVVVMPIEFESILFKEANDSIFRKIYNFKEQNKCYRKGVSPFFINTLLSERGWIIFPANTDQIGFIDNENNEIRFVNVFLKNNIEIPNESYINKLTKENSVEGVDMNLNEFMDILCS